MIQMALHFWLLSTVGEAKSGSIHLLFILISVSLSALSVDRRLRLSVTMPPAALNTLSDSTLAAGQASTSKAYRDSSSHVSNLETQ